MTEPTVDPSQVYALVVGIEQYLAGPEYNLNGPARDALNFAQWLLTHGVQPAHIQLFLSPLEQNREVLTEAAEQGLTPQTATRDLISRSITNYFFNQGGRDKGLYVFWAGHGFITKLKTTIRRLLFADTDTHNKWNLEFDTLLQAFQTAQHGKVFPRQIFWVDACANPMFRDFYPTLQAEAAGEGFVTSGTQGQAEQFALFAAAEYAVATNLAQAGTGRFSQAVLAELQAQPLWPDMPELTRQIRANFCDQQHLEPVYWSIALGGGDREVTDNIDQRITARTVTSVTMSTSERLQLIQTLNNLPIVEFEVLVKTLNPPGGLVSPPSTAQGLRSSELLGWIEGSTGPGLNELQAVLGQVMVGKTLQHKVKYPGKNNTLEIDAETKKLRKQLSSYIKLKCGKMRVLDMEQPIEIGEIYTAVNILEKITGRSYFEITDLTNQISVGNFNRPFLGKIREERVPGISAVKKFSKLMILGKPGAGKTTFLKHLAISCISGSFQATHLPIFITLKDFAETKGKPGLDDYIKNHLTSLPISFCISIQTIFELGKAIILLDGLDEVRDIDIGRIVKEIKNFSEKYHENQFVITSRIAAREYVFEPFTEVEVADFDKKQISDFVSKWFKAKKDLKKSEIFLRKLRQDESTLELASSPLLLTLLCLVFEDTGDFPINRAELYQTGIDVLLKKWDVKRNIERDQIYKGISLKRKQDLLSYAAKSTFDIGRYFFKQREIEKIIAQYIQNLPNASTAPEILELDSSAVLKSIESQHGLLVERARKIYSFSHLTFHEYFTARKFVSDCNPHSENDCLLNELASHVTEKRWREVFLLTFNLLEPADVLLLLMRRKVDGFLNDSQIKSFLIWTHKSFKDLEISTPRTPREIFNFRKFYISLTRNIFTELDKNHSFQVAIDFENLDDVLDIAIECSLGNVYDLVYETGVLLDDAENAVFIIAKKCALNNAVNSFIKNVGLMIEDYDFSVTYCFDFEFFDFDPNTWKKLLRLEMKLQIKFENHPVLVRRIKSKLLSRIENFVSSKSYEKQDNNLINFLTLLFHNDDFWKKVNEIYKLDEVKQYTYFKEYVLDEVWRKVEEEFPDGDLSGDLGDILELVMPDDRTWDQIYQKYELERQDLFSDWWIKKGDQWLSSLRNILTQEMNLGYNWEFSHEHIENINLYLEGNSLIIDCLESDCYVSRELRVDTEIKLLSLLA
jgi:hypothetical protein